jgi:FKBP-type peptidyl-prolyl cis-trans isomerase
MYFINTRHMLKRFHLWILLISVSTLSIITGACSKNDWAAKEQKEKDLINQYVKENNISDDKKLQSGIYFIEEKAGTGLTPKKDDYVIINFTGRYIENNRIHETSYDSLKGEWDHADLYSTYVYGPLRFQYGYSIAGINEGLSLMKEGGKAQILIPSDMAFYDYNPMIYEIELLKVVEYPAKYDSIVLKNYMTQNGWSDDDLRPLKEVYYKETFTPDPNDEHHFGDKDTLYFNYTGKLLDGYNPTVTERVFEAHEDTLNPVKYYKGGASGLPQGLRNALDTLRMGTEATYLVPSAKAYGDKGLINSAYGYTIVPPYQSLVYYIKVRDLKYGALKK